MGKDAPEGAAEIETTPGPYDGGSTAAAPTQAPPPLPASVGSVPARVSYTGLATYGRCPYRFYLTSIAKLPAPPSAQGGEALAFGSAVHMVLERCRHPHDDPAPWIDAALLATGLSSGSRARLAAAVDAYRSSQTAAETWRAPQTLFEAPIAVPVGGTVLAGAIDVIAWNGDEALIVDYKTGTGPLTAQEAAERYRLQAECYALAAFAAGADTVRVVFSELERARETDFTFAVEDCARIRADVEAIIGEMGSNGFAPRAFYERELCETCPGLGGVCPVTRPLGGAAG
jgi:RecB family exonuclease